MKIPHALLALSLCSLPMGCASPESQDSAYTLQLAELSSWVEHLSPAGDELAFEAIGWIPDFADGVRAADARQRPLLFWAMNGHPLGCT